MATISSEDDAAAWAHRNLAAKNTLTAADAKIVEEQFQAKLGTIRDGTDPAHSVPCEKIACAGQADPVTNEKAEAAVARRSRRSEVTSLGKTIRLRDKDHRKFVLRQPCLLCGRVPSDPHHLTFTQPRALGRRVSDEFTVPVCRIHHRELHRSGDEAAWWRSLNIDPLPVALKLWQQSRADGELFPSVAVVSQTPPTNTPNPSAQDRSSANDPNASI
jgi:hypothetical protein